MYYKFLSDIIYYTIFFFFFLKEKKVWVSKKSFS